MKNSKERTLSVRTYLCMDQTGLVWFWRWRKRLDKKIEKGGPNYEEAHYLKTINIKTKEPSSIRIGAVRPRPTEADHQG